MIEEEDETSGATAPLETLERFFTARGWPFDRNGDDELVVTVSGSWAEYELRAIWREDDAVLQFLALPDIRVPGTKRAAMYETLGLVNEQLWIGHFEMWARSGLLLFRHAALLEGNAECPLTPEQAETLVDATLDEWERFYPVFQFVLWSDKTPTEAIAAAMIETHGEA